MTIFLTPGKWYKQHSMSYTEKLKQIGGLKGIADGFGPLPLDLLNKINNKFRLEWNYTSNRMEGNSLTKTETRSVMAGSIHVRGRSLKDIAEIQGHDKVVTAILGMSRGELTISESRIKEVHKMIMYEDDKEKERLRGMWKPYNNYLEKDDGEPYYFTDFLDVPAKMHELVNWVNAEYIKTERYTKDSLHPVILAAEFHLRYINIHPFYDGNGRTARIFTNIILIAHGYPPVYITKLDEAPYYSLLDEIQRFGAAPDEFYSFICDLVIRSQGFVLNGIEGRDIEEPDDIDKEIALWKKALPQEAAAGMPRTDETIYHLYQDSLLPLFNNLVAKYRLFENLFARADIYGIVNGTGSENGLEFIDAQLQGFYNSLGGFMDPGGVPPTPQRPNFYKIRLQIELRAFKRTPHDMFDYVPYIEIDFKEYSWTIQGPGIKKMTKLYEDNLTEEEIMKIVAESIRNTKEYIDNRIKNTNDHN